MKLFCVILVCVSSMCLCARAQVGSKGGLTREYGVKLCGREFIRAVIFTCGGSRWRRLSEDAEYNPFLKSTVNTFPEDGDSLSRLQLHLQTQILHNPVQLLEQLSPKDLINLYADYKESVAKDLGELLPLVDEGRKKQQLQTVDQEGGSARMTNLNIPWLKSPSRKRNLSVGLAGICCNQGCTKNDIGRLC
ncbi:REL3 protein, partial [Amia calva]|nr:REL3 protein [Amia calva]